MMRLAKLTLAGFKSFAGRTEFTFDAPITGIVGPNGCGKSNVVDAIKWVLGERSAKSLRGKEMIDVIFSGSAGRQPLGMASVVLSFDNPELTAVELAALEAIRGGDAGAKPVAIEGVEAAEGDDEGAEAALLFDRSGDRRRALPIDSERVDVERRLYRDGTSHYLINGKKARLRDIRDLFLDTGVGADAYSIIEQGKVDALLLASPYERRTFFEEAAGVARFKVRRVEAQRKLERTETNLIRVREQLDSTERRLRLVKGQAAKARRFVTLDGELKSLRLAVSFEQYDDLQQRLAGLTSQLQDLESQRRGAMEELAALEDEKQSAEVERHETSEKHRAAEREKAAAEHRLQSSQQRRGMTERNASESRSHLAEDRRRLESIEQQSAGLDREIDHHAAAVEDLTDMVNKAETALREHAAARETAQTALADHRFVLAGHRASSQNIDRELTGLVARLDADQRRLHGLAEQQQRLDSRLAILDREASESSASLAAADGEVASRRAQIASLETQVADLVSSAVTVSDDQRALASRLNEQEQQRARLDSRRATLQEMVDSRVGLGDAVKSVLERAEAARGDPAQTGSLLAQVLAPLAELIEVEAEDAPAVEAALAGTLQAVVVPSLGALLATDGFAWLSGRVAFLPLDVAGSRLDQVSALAVDGVVPVASLVHVAERYRPLVNRLLGRTYLVRDMDAAVMLAAGPASGIGARFVTRAGALLEADGRVVLGPMRGVEQGEGLLQRRSELTVLESKLDEMDVSLARDRASLASIDARAGELNREMAALRVALAAEQRQIVAEESRRQRHQGEVERLGRERPGVESELAQATERAKVIHAEHRAIEERAESLRRLFDEQLSVARGIEQQIEASQHAADTAGERLTAAKVEAGQLAEKLSSVRRELRRLELAREEASQQRLRLSQSVEHREATIEGHERVLAECASEMADAERQASEWATGMAAHAATIAESASRVATAADRVQGARQRASIIERDFYSIEASKRELEVRRESLEQRAQEDLTIDLAWEYPEYRGMMADGDVRRIDVDGAQPEIESLRADIKKLGNVNLDAIEEEATLEGRNEELIRQVADIDAAVTQLKQLIERLSVVSMERFKRSFETIQGYFSGPSGMFRRLFGGGKAELRLMPLPDTGEIDWLESGIEVVAKPPGKEPRSISQLSGGEKTMTAVALLMSIFQSKPSPFCVLDEVDAALDDSNVERFGGILRQFLDRCHFIVITHNKKTMQVADQLYGVTMQERGVSRRVQVKFEHIGEGGAIELDAREGQRIEEAPIDAVRKGMAAGTRERLAKMRKGKKAVEVASPPVEAPIEAAQPLQGV